MNETTLLADAVKKVDEALALCNQKAKALLAETTPFTGRSAERVLGADVDRVMSLAMDVVDARAKLNMAFDELASLKRRAQS